MREKRGQTRKRQSFVDDAAHFDAHEREMGGCSSAAARCELWLRWAEAVHYKN